LALLKVSDILVSVLTAYGFQTKRFTLNYIEFNKSSDQSMQSINDVLAV